MSKKSLLLIGAFILLIIVISGNPFYVITEGQQVVITQFGRPVGKAITKAGLKIKIPFIQKVNYFEKRLLEWDGYPTQIPTLDKKYIWVDTMARWIIKDPLKFLQSVYNERGAQSRLDDIINAAVRNTVTAHDLISIVRSSNRILEVRKAKQVHERQELVQEEGLKKIKVGRNEVRKEILAQIKKLAYRYGIEVVDVRIKRVNYIGTVRQKVYGRMIAERRRAADKYRSEGRGISAEIAGKREKEVKSIISAAYKQSQKIKGKAEATATKIYADAYNKDIDFFTFLKTLSTYKNTVDANTTIILTTDAAYFKYLKKLYPANNFLQK